MGHGTLGECTLPRPSLLDEPPIVVVEAAVGHVRGLVPFRRAVNAGEIDWRGISSAERSVNGFVELLQRSIATWSSVRAARVGSSSVHCHGRNEEEEDIDQFSLRLDKNR